MEYLVAKDDGGNRDYILVTENGIPRFYIFVSNSTKSVLGTTDISDGKWHHVAGVNDGTNLKIYVDGKLENSNTDGGTIDTDPAVVSIAARGDGDDEFTGTIARASIWAEALSVGQIRNMMFKDWTAMAADNYDASSNPNGFTDSNAKLWYEFNEGVDNAAPSGTDVEDLSAQSNNCLLYTSPSPRDS